MSNGRSSLLSRRSPRTGSNFIGSMLAVVMFATGLGSRAGCADEPVSGNVADKNVVTRAIVENLVQQLNAETLNERTKAERTLIDLGPDVLLYLPPPELTTGAAAKVSVKNVRVQLERRAARMSAEGSLVSLLKPDEISLDSLLAFIFNQTRNRVTLAESALPLKNRMLAVRVQKKLFWEVVDDVCSELSLQAHYDASRRSLVLAPNTRQTKPLAVQRTGPFRIEIHSVENRPIDGTTNRLLRLNGTVSVEPRLRPLFLHFAANDFKLALSSGKDDSPVSLKPWNPVAKYEHPVGDAGRDVTVQFDHVLPADAVATASPKEAKVAPTVALSGRLAVQMAAGTERIVFDKEAQTVGAARRRGGVTVRLREVIFEPMEKEDSFTKAPSTTKEQPDRMRAEIGVTVTYDAGGPAFESHRTWMFHNAVYLETEAGRRIDFTDYDTSQQGDGAVGVTYRWQQLAAPATQYRFVYEAPTLIIDVPVEVKLERIPIDPAGQR